MLTIFSIPKAFEGHVGIIQKNAIQSWTKLPDCRVILFGKEVGLAEVATELGVEHEPLIARNEFGTPMVSDAFELIRSLSHTPLLAYVNSDILLTKDIVEAASALTASSFPTWLMVGQRHDIDITEEIDFGEGWEARFQRDVAMRAILHGKSGIDFFLFPRNFPVRLPPMAVGRPGWDGSLIYQTRASGIPLVDVTNVVRTIHQNHPRVYRSNGHEARKNRLVAGGNSCLGTLRDANWILSGDRETGLKLRVSRFGQLVFKPPIRKLLGLKRFVQSFMP